MRTRPTRELALPIPGVHTFLHRKEAPMFLKIVARVLVTLNSNKNAAQVAAGFASGVLLALIPAGNLVWISLFLILFLTKAHYGTAMAALAVVKLAAPLLAVPLDALGWTILNAEALRPAFTNLYGLPVAPLTRFNNTLVMGGLAAGVLLWAPVFLAARIGVSAYRTRVAPRFAESRLAKAIKRLPWAGKLAKAVSAASRIAGPAE